MLSPGVEDLDAVNLPNSLHATMSSQLDRMEPSIVAVLKAAWWRARVPRGTHPLSITIELTHSAACQPRYVAADGKCAFALRLYGSAEAPPTARNRNRGALHGRSTGQRFCAAHLNVRMRRSSQLVAPRT